MKNKTSRICPHLKIYMGLFLFYWATWKCFMVNLRDTRGGRGVGGRPLLRWSLATWLIQYITCKSAFGKTAQVSSSSVNTVLSIASISGGQGVTYCSNGVHVTYVDFCSITFLRRDGWILMYKCMEIISFTSMVFHVKVWYDCKYNAVYQQLVIIQREGDLFIRVFHSTVVLQVMFWVWLWVWLGL